MNKSQTAALLADFDDPRLTELDLCERHALTLDALLAIAESPPFRHALATLRALRDARAPALLARARLSAARALAHLSDHTPASLAESRELRLALKDLLRLLAESSPVADGGGGRRSRTEGEVQSDSPTPSTPTMSKANRGVPQASPPRADAPLRDAHDEIVGFPHPTDADPGCHGLSRKPCPEPLTPPPSGQWQVPSPSPRPRPKRPRNTKPRPKARSR